MHRDLEAPQDLGGERSGRGREPDVDAYVAGDLSVASKDHDSATVNVVGLGLFRLSGEGDDVSGQSALAKRSREGASGIRCARGGHHAAAAAAQDDKNSGERISHRPPQVGRMVGDVRDIAVAPVIRKKERICPLRVMNAMKAGNSARGSACRGEHGGRYEQNDHTGAPS